MEVSEKCRAGSRRPFAYAGFPGSTMYIPTHFEETDVTRLHELVRANPFGTLVTVTPTGLDANHIPFLVSPGPPPFGTLHGHVARANPVWRDARTDAEALVIFQGADRYISPSWYASKQETQKAVPTWNYVVVHAHGPLRFIDDSAWIRTHLEALTREHESSREAPWSVGDAPPGYIDAMMQHVVGIEMPIARLTGKWKVSQNRSPRDRQGVVEGLSREGTASAAAMAELVRRTLDS